MKHKLLRILAIALAVALFMGAVGCDDPSDPWTENVYFTNLYVWNSTNWVHVTGGGGGGGAGLWETDGGDAELIVPDTIDMQSQYIHNVLDPLLNQDAATKLYVDAADTVLTNDLATNVTQINTNVGNIATNAADIATNTADIATNATAITTNAANIATNVANIATNAANIASNAADIASNASRIDTNEVNIATNTADIASNVSAIVANAANIATNTADIASNASRISTNTADIASNASAIATNTANIATNTADIASNATALATHVADASVHTTITTAAVTLYVDAGAGDDSNDGSSGSPTETIDGALDLLPTVIAHPVTINVRGPQNYPENNVTLDFARFATLDTITIQAVNSNDEDMFDHGQADAGAGNDELDDATKSWSVDQFNGAYLMIYRGTGEGQIRTISDTTATKLTVSVNWAVNPDGTSYYAVIGGASMTGTGTTHAYVSGKNVRFYGFRHTGATSYDVACDSGALVYNYNSYHQSGSVGFLANTGAFGYAFFNWYDGTLRGVQIQTATMYPRASVFYGMTTGCTINYGGLSVMYSFGAVYENYFDTCTTGIDAVTGSGSVAATNQGYNGCVTDHSVDATSWET